MTLVTTPRKIRFKLNGRPVSANVMPHETIVDMLYGQFDLTGARESCGQGLCGCCTVHVDGKPVSGCLSLAAFLDGRPFAECLRWAAVAGSLSTRAAGGTTAQATRAELLGLV